MFRGTTFRYVGGFSLIALTVAATVQWTRSRYDDRPPPREGPDVVRDRAVPGTTTSVATSGPAVDGGEITIDRGDERGS